MAQDLSWPFLNLLRQRGVAINVACQNWAEESHGKTTFNVSWTSLDLPLPQIAPSDCQAGISQLPASYWLGN